MNTFSQEFKNIIPEDTRIITVTWLARGDEGKGKVADTMQGRFDVVAAPNGWGNAGHNVIINGRKEHFHELPGASHSAQTVYISQGRICNLFSLEKELKMLHDLQGQEKTWLVIANNASLIVPSLQRYLDSKIEQAKKNLTWWNVWSTWSWIGPGYMLRAMRSELNVWSILTHTDKKINNTIEVLWKIFKNLNLNKIHYEYLQSKKILKNLIDKKIISIDRFNSFIPFNLEHNPSRRIIVECAQSVMLSLSSGSFPNCTSSECGFNGILPSLGINNPWLKIGVIKAVASKVWSGRFATQRGEHNGVSKEFTESYRQIAGEFWATTGRPRDIGYLDIVQLKHICKTGNAPDILWINMVDMLATLAENNITNKVATSYNIIHPQTQKVLQSYDTVPTENMTLESVWYTTISDVKGPDDYANYVQDIRKLSWFTGPIVVWTWPWAEDNILFNI